MRVIVTAGGTGGHIYPGLAIINKIKKENPNSEFLFIGTNDRMEKDLIPTYNINYQGITIYGMDRKLSFNNIKNINLLIKAIKKCKKIIKEFKPDIVIGTGGYVTFPVLYAASKLNVLTMIHEQNSVIGLSNKILLTHVDKIALSFPIDDISKYSNKTVISGNPCYENAFFSKTASKKDYGLDNDKKLVLITMGSLGSKTVNEKMKTILSELSTKNYEVIFVTGKKYFQEFDYKYKNIKIFPYLNDFTSVMKMADLFVSRAGASALSEIAAVRIPTILIPSKYVTNNHQYKNALTFVSNSAAILLDEDEISLLPNKISDLLSNQVKINTIKENLSKIMINNSSDIIYNEIISLIKEKNDGKNQKRDC